MASGSALTVLLQNETSSETVYAYVTGLAIDNNNALFLLQSDGKTGYYPSSPSDLLSPLGADCAIALGAPGHVVPVTIPHLAGARIWFSVNSPLTFYLNPGPALVEPSVSNKSDPNYNISWDFCEFTFNNAQLYANITFVDFVCLPIGLALADSSATLQVVKGLPSNGLDTVCTSLEAQSTVDGTGWNQLIVSKDNGTPLRALSPNTGIVMNNSLFSAYYKPYVDQVWAKYTSSTLTVDTQMAAGALTAHVVNGELRFSGGAASYAQPSTADIFSCSSGPFVPTGDPIEDAITARLAAGFNRSTLLIDTDQPDDEAVATYYQNHITNHYAKICHATAIDHLGYAFPYDDVGPTNGPNVSGFVAAADPMLFSVVVGGGGNAGATAQAHAEALKAAGPVSQDSVSVVQDASAANQQQQKTFHLRGLGKSLLLRLSWKKRN